MELANKDNSIEAVSYREKVKALSDAMTHQIDTGVSEAVDCPVEHYFVPDELSGYCVYAREVRMPKGSVVVGKIHKQPTLNILSKGKLSIIKDGKKVTLEAPYTYVGTPGEQKTAYIEEDVVWLNIHITKHTDKSEVEAIEKEVIAETYEELGLLSSLSNLQDLGE